MNKKVLFLDLEETVIKSWDNPELINVDKIKNFIKKISPDEINILSVAIWCNSDVEIFMERYKGVIEKALAIRMNKVYAMSDFIKQSSWGNCSFESRMESMMVVGKFRIFEDFCERNLPKTFCLLIDDNCPSKIIVNMDTETTINLVNVDKL